MSPENGKLNSASSLFLKPTHNNAVRGQYMTPEDLQNIQVSMNEFFGKAVLPYVERQVRLLHEMVSVSVNCRKRNE
jgi:hypothetical protein